MGFWVAILLVGLACLFLPAFFRGLSGQDQRRCLACQYRGTMKTWLGGYFAPQLIALLGLLFFVIPGIIFIAISAGKFKCPKCGAIGKNILVKNNPPILNAAPQPAGNIPCPWCAETIKSQAKICKHCQREIKKDSPRDHHQAILEN